MKGEDEARPARAGKNPLFYCCIALLLAALFLGPLFVNTRARLSPRPDRLPGTDPDATRVTDAPGAILAPRTAAAENASAAAPGAIPDR